MLDGILNNRKEWNAKKEEYEASLKEIEDAKKAKEEAAGAKGKQDLQSSELINQFVSFLTVIFFTRIYILNLKTCFEC